MSLRTVLIPLIILYIGFLYWLFKRLDYKALWQGPSVETNDISVSSSRLTSFVKIVLDIFMMLLTVVLIVWPPLLVIMAISQSVNPSWGIDISIFSGFKIDIDALSSVESTGLRNPQITGKTLLNIDTSNIHAWHLFAFHSEFGALIALYGLVQLRALVIVLKAGQVFSEANSQRIKKLGYVIIFWNVLQPFFQYYGWGSVINQISFNTQGIMFYPSFEINSAVIFIGLLMIILSDMLNKAAILSNEQRLTI